MISLWCPEGIYLIKIIQWYVAWSKEYANAFTKKMEENTKMKRSRINYRRKQKKKMERSLNNNEIMLLVVLYQRKFRPGWNHSHLFGNRKRLPRSHVGVGLPQIQYLQGCKTPANNIHYQISCCYLTFISLASCPIMK